jgi:hypothetical protein
MTQFSKIENCTQILLSVLRYTSVKSDQFNQDENQKKLIKALKFNEITDDLLYRSCIDVIEDTQLAINEYHKNGLGNESGNLGEKYLRLYGLLNAYYIQLGAVIDISRLLNSKNQKEIKEKLKTHKLIEIRNKLGSHITNYSLQNESKEKDFFRLSQFHLSQDKKADNLFIVGKNSAKEISITNLMLDFTEQIELILIELVKDAIFGKRKYKPEHLEWMKDKYNDLLEITKHV